MQPRQRPAAKRSNGRTQPLDRQRPAQDAIAASQAARPAHHGGAFGIGRLRPYPAKGFVGGAFVISDRDAVREIDLRPENSGCVERAADDDAAEQNLRVSLVGRRGFGDFGRVGNERLTTGEPSAFGGRASSSSRRVNGVGRRRRLPIR